jgi:fluoroquinolone transport system permease protein
MTARLLAARPIARTINWPALGGSMIPAFLIVWHFATQTYGTAGDAALSLRLAALSLAVGVAFVLDDPSEGTIAPAPVSLLARRCLRISLTVPAAVGVWLVLHRLANGAAYLSNPLPVRGLIVEVLAFTVLALAGASGAQGQLEGLGGAGGAATVMLVGIATALFPWGHQLLGLLPGTEAYRASQGWWWALLGAGVMMIVGTSVPLQRSLLTRMRSG